MSNTIRISELSTIVPTSNTLFVVSRDFTSYNVPLTTIISKIRNNINSSYLKLTDTAAEDDILVYNNGTWSSINPVNMPSYPAKQGKIASLGHIHDNGIVMSAITKAGKAIMWGYLGETVNGSHGDSSMAPTQARLIQFFDTDMSDYLFNNPGVTIQQVIRSENRLAGLLSDGTVWLAGYGDQLGLGSAFTTEWTYGLRKVNFPDGAVIKSIHLGGCSSTRYDDFYGAISTTNDLYLWGFNGAGQLGTGDTTKVTSPIKVTHSSLVNNVKTVAMGGFNNNPAQGTTAVVTLNGELWCTGYNAFGQCGVGNTTGSTTFRQAMQVDGNNLTDVRDLGRSTVGTNTNIYAIKNDGTVWAAGDNAYYQLGLGTTEDKTLFNQIPGLTNITKLLFNGQQDVPKTCIAMSSTGAVYTWGNNTTVGACGIGAYSALPASVTTPAMVNERGATDIFIDNHEGHYPTTAFLKDKQFYSSGNQSSGTSNDNSYVAHAATPLKNVVDARATGGSPWYYHGSWMLLTEDGDVWCLGWTHYSLGGAYRNGHSTLTPVKLKFNL